MALRDLSRRLSHIERECYRPSPKHSLLIHWIEVLRGFDPSLTDEEVAEQARQWAEAGETFSQWHARILAEIWSDPETRRRAGLPLL